VGVALLSIIPKAVLGVLLLYAGLELALLVRDVNERNDLFIGLLIAGVALATTHMGLAFAAGMAASFILRWGRIRI
jgi:SulP family sulfate permease